MKQEKNNLLWISFMVPYDGVPHAGGKIHNYYIKELVKLQHFNVRLLTFAQEKELQKIDLEKYNIQYDLIVHHSKGIKHLFWGGLNKLNSINFFDSNGGFVPPYVYFSLRKKLKEIKLSGYEPEVIVLQWTRMVLMIDYVKKLFPNAKIVTIEEDVYFLSYLRKYESEKNVFLKFIKKRAYENLRKKELVSLDTSELIIVNNCKDYKLLKDNKIKTDMWEWSPYFQSLSSKNYIGDCNDIVYYGAMSRPENWKSAIWFIENVWPKISDLDIRFVVVGNNPHKELLKYESEKIVFTGFVDDITPYLQHSLCMVAPLVMGAGVKIKVIEGLSLGMPILTNNIGIEGISAMHMQHYFHCENPSEYAETIRKIVKREIDVKGVSSEAKKLVLQKYNYEESLYEFDKRLRQLCIGGNESVSK